MEDLKRQLRRQQEIERVRSEDAARKAVAAMLSSQGTMFQRAALIGWRKITRELKQERVVE